MEAVRVAPSISQQMLGMCNDKVIEEIATGGVSKLYTKYAQRKDARKEWIKRSGDKSPWEVAVKGGAGLIFH